ncbi:MAG: response regulator [Pseudomonadota bacterium]
MQVLLVDPVHSSREALAQQLSDMSFEPIIARDGMEAWTLLREKAINLVISEWHLPRVSGFELCRKIRSIEKDEYIYIFILIGKEEVQSLRDVFKSGADDCLLKPLNPHLFSARLQSGKRIIHLGRKNKELQNTIVESRNKLRIVFDSLPEEIVATDGDGRIQSLNRAYVENRNAGFTDLWHQQIKAEDLYFLEKFDKSLFAASFNSVILTGKPVIIRDLATTQDDKIQHKEIHFLPVKAENGRMKQIIIIARDIPD